MSKMSETVQRHPVWAAVPAIAAGFVMGLMLHDRLQRGPWLSLACVPLFVVGVLSRRHRRNRPPLEAA